MSNNFCSIDDVTSSGNNSNRNLLDNLNFMNFHLLQNTNSIDKNSSSVSSSSPLSSSAAVNYHSAYRLQSNNLDFTNNLVSNKIVKDLVIPTGRSITGINYKKKLNTTTSLDLEGMGSQTKTFGNGEGKNNFYLIFILMWDIAGLGTIHVKFEFELCLLIKRSKSNILIT